MTFKDLPQYAFFTFKQAPHSVYIKLNDSDRLVINSGRTHETRDLAEVIRLFPEEVSKDTFRFKKRHLTTNVLIVGDKFKNQYGVEFIKARIKGDVVFICLETGEQGFFDENEEITILNKESK